MADQTVYMIVNLTVTDEDSYLKYARGFFPLLKRHGGEFVTFDDDHATFEGSAPRTGRMIIFTFPSEEQARAWYDDPEYQEISKLRRAGTNLEFLTMVHSRSQP